MTMARPPITIPPALDPLTKEQRWVGWRWIKGKDGKLTKPPFRADAPHLHASSTDPSTWSPFEVAMGAYCRGQVDGIGFALSGSRLAAEDLDDCRIAESGVLNPWAAEQIRRAGSYAEVTPSNEGVRVIGLASGPPVHRKFNVPNNGGMSCELYRGADRYICITGQQIGNAGELVNIDAQIDGLLVELDGAKRANGAKQGAKQGNSAKNGKQQHDLDALIKDGCGQDFGGDRSRATWYVIHQLLKQGRSPNDIVGILIDPANGISAHCLDQSRPEDYARKQVEKAQGESAGADGTDAEIERLAKLSTVQYEQERKGAASQLGVRASILDRLVQAEREKLGLVEDDGRQGRAIEFPEPSAWPEPVEGSALLNTMAAAIRSHVVMSNTSGHVAALWVLHDWLIDCFVISPRLGIRSATKGCGKTLLLDVLGRLVRRPLRTLSITPAATFRVVEGWQPTLLIDEADTFLNDNEGLRGILDGNRKGDTVLRTVGDDYEVRAFATYGAVAIALIGTLPDTLHDRSVVIDLKRRLLKERIVPFRFDRAGHLDVLARMAVRWAADNAERIAALDPKMPKGVINRAADNWRPLAAIAAVAGGRWPARLAQAATAALAAGTTEDASRLELLLGDIRDAFDTDKAEARRDMFGVEQIEIASADLVKILVALDGRPWAELGKSRKPLTQNGLARRLKPLGIAPGNVGPEAARVRGYVRAHFKEAFERYLSAEGVTQPPIRPECDEISTSDISEVPSREDGCAVANEQKTQQPRASVQMGSCEGDTEDETPPGLSHRNILDLARWYIESAEAQRQDEGDVDSTVLDAGLREVLAEMVLPELVEVEVERVMVEVFRV